MALVPFLEREQISNGQHYDTAEKVVGVAATAAVSQ